MAKRKQEAGAHPSLLDKPRILFSEPGTIAQLLFYGPLFLLGSFGAMGCFFGSFQVPIAPAPVVVTGVVCLLFSLLLFLVKRPSWILSLAGIVLWVGAVWRFFGDLIQGCAHITNLVLEAYSDKFGLALPFLAVTPGLTEQDILRQCTIFCCLFTFPYLFFLGWVLVGRKSALGSFCLTGLLVLFPMVISRIPPTPYLVALLLFWAMLLLFSPSFGQRHRLLEDHGKFHASGNGMARPSMLLLLFSGAALCMALTYFLVPYATYQRPQIATDLLEGFSQGFGLEKTFQGGVGNGNGKVELSSLGSRSYTGKTMLRVQYEWTPLSDSNVEPSNGKKDFLKSFVGSVYTGRSWERLSPQDSGELEEILNGEHPQNLLDKITLEFPSYILPQYQLTVENVGANPRCIYVPYGLMGNSVDPSLMGYVEDGFLQSTRLFSGTPSYSLDAWGIPQQLRYYPDVAINGILQDYLSAQDPDSSRFQNLYDLSQSSEVRDLISQLQDSLYNETGEAVCFDLWTIPGDMSGYLTQEHQEFTQTLEKYNQFVFDHYTQLPDPLRDTLTQFLEENGIYPDQTYTLNSSPYYLVQQIANTLASRCTYTLTPPSLPEGKDFVEYFLFESQQGYCVHFATAAVALLRAAGVPARYAEGYAVPAGETGWVEVPDYNAHAWVEIYLGGTGWVPMEVTPAGPDAPAATEDALPMEAQAVTPTPVPTPSPTPTPSPSPTAEASPSAMPSAQPNLSPSPAPGAVPGNTPSSGRAWLIAGCILGGLCLLIGGILLRWKILRRCQEKRFSQKNRNQSALALYAAILELYATAQNYLPTWQEEIPPRLEKLALKARFSQHTLTPEELLLFQKEWGHMANRLQELLPTFPRLWCKYIRALF